VFSFSFPLGRKAEPVKKVKLGKEKHTSISGMKSDFYFPGV
jgi:hypothetical protein